MCPNIYFPRFESAFRRVFVGLCITAHLAATTGFPLPQPKELPAGSARFPCENHRCGCTSADHCWRSCCCMSTAEKLAWAKRNGVTPPEYLLAAAEEPERNASGSCCAQDAQSSSSCRKAVAARSCCSGHETETEECTPTVNADDESSTTLTWVHGIQAQHCQGLATIWIVSGAVLPPPIPVAAPTDLTPPTWFRPAKLCQRQPLSSPPDVPPPRVA